MKEGWEYKKLNEVCDVEYGTRVVQKKDGGTIYPVYGGGGETFRMDRFNRESCIVIARFAMSKQCTRFVKGKFFLNDSGLTLKCNDSSMIESFLNWHILALNDEIYLLGKGMAQKNLDMPSFRTITLKIPPLSEQQHIVEELDLLSSIIEKKKAQLNELDNMAQSLFYEMFGDPIINEKGWEKKTVGEIASFFNGKAHEKDIDENGEFILVNAKFISTRGEILKRTNKQIFPLVKDDIVMVMSDLPNGKTLAKCFLIETNNLYTLNQRICAFRNYSLVPRFFLYTLNRNRYFLDFDDGKAQTNLRKADVIGCPIILPTYTLQQQFASKIQGIEQQKELIKQSIKEVETLFNSRMDYYFS